MWTRVLIIRHGQSTWNAERRWQGQADPPLTRLGEHQAFEAARQLGTFDAILSSDLRRAALSAQIIADQLAIGPVLGDSRLRETFAGAWQGLTADDINRAYPGYLEQHRRPPDFEAAERVVERVTAALVEMTRLCPGGEVLAISHGGVVRVMTRIHGGHETSVPNLGGGWFDVSTEGTIRVGPTVDLLSGWDAGSITSRSNDVTPGRNVGATAALAHHGETVSAGRSHAQDDDDDSERV
jgi:broad specificity phosphatase PhoE